MPTADPCDLDSERALLGAVLVVPEFGNRLEVEAGDFYRETHGLIWDAAIRCVGNGGCDVISVSAELKRRGQLEQIGGKERLAELAATVRVPGHAQAYAERVKETAELRRIRDFAQQTLEAVDQEDKDGIARALDALGQRVLYVDVGSGEVVETCPTCVQNERIIEKKEHQERSLLARISMLEGKAEREAREHKLYPEIAACFDFYRLATAHFEVRFTSEEFRQALPRWKQYGKGRANPCKPALKAIAGIAYDPTKTRGRNKRQRVYDSWELLNRNQFSWPDFHKRVPKAANHPPACECGDCETAWWRCLMNCIAGNLKPAA